uniref:Response regulatory domain-containing protein n=1 Tax=Leersia perrieri TaxID=77586 RepID=A0A0D9W3P3_9ORYZ
MAQMLGQSGDGVFIMIVDEDICHANSARDMLSSLNFHVIVYSSPKHALTFLENNAQDVAFVLAEVDMKPFSGFEFLKDAKKIRKDLQVLMMSAETTMATMMRCARLGACFLLKKPLSDDAVSNLWQHVNLKALRREKIKELLQVRGRETMDVMSYDEQASKETEANEAEEVGEVNSSEANKNVKSVQVESNEKGDGIAKICDIDAAKGAMPNKIKYELSGDLKVSSGDDHLVPEANNNVDATEGIGSNSSDEEVSNETKSAANVGKVSLVDYPDFEDDETNKPTST